MHFEPITFKHYNISLRLTALIICFFVILIVPVFFFGRFWRFSKVWIKLCFQINHEPLRMWFFVNISNKILHISFESNRINTALHFSNQVKRKKLGFGILFGNPSLTQQNYDSFFETKMFSFHFVKFFQDQLDCFQIKTKWSGDQLIYWANLY